jgi:hypothetical protein
MLERIRLDHFEEDPLVPAGSAAALICDTGALIDYLVESAPDRSASATAIDRLTQSLRSTYRPTSYPATAGVTRAT